MTYFLSRIVAIEQNGEHQTFSSEELRSCHAYILLGDAGMGKTTLFEQEKKALGEAALYCTIQDFLDFYAGHSADDFVGKTLFIDGLDEARSRGDQSITSALRKLLAKLGRPRFRLSCRAAEWFGETDNRDFSALLPSGETLPIAYLQPFSRDDVVRYLQAKNIDSETFIERAEQAGVAELLDNPQTLNMLLAAVDGDQGWPQSKKGVFELACRKLAEEHNERHRPKQVHSIDDLLVAAGYWSAAMLLSSRSCASLNLPDGADRVSLQASQGFERRELPLGAVLRTRLFQGDGQGDHHYPHRSVAEFLAARYIAQRLAEGLPLPRVWSLLCGVDGGVVSNLRGLYGWLASLAGPAHLHELIEKDPLALLVYGDARHLGREAKTRLITALRQHIKRHPRFRSDAGRWLDQEFGALATPDMEDVFRQHLTSFDSADEGQLLAGCLLSAIEYGSPMPALQALLASIVRNDDHWEGVRRFALQALLAHEANTAVCLDVLAALHRGDISDPDREMLGSLLTAYYPDKVKPDAVLKYFQPQADSRLIGDYRYFWPGRLAERTPLEALPALLTQALLIDPDQLGDAYGRHEFDEMVGKLFARVLEALGESLPVERLSQWLDDRATVMLGQPARNAARVWAQGYPEKYQQLLLYLLRSGETSQPLSSFWRALNCMGQPEWLWPWVMDSLKQDTCADIRLPLLDLAKQGLYAPLVPYDLNDLYALSQLYPELAERLDDLYCDLIENEWQIRHSRRTSEWQAQERGRWEKNHQAILAEREQLANGMVRLDYLDWLARHYWRAFPYGQPAKRTETPLSILTTELNGDEDLARLALHALLQTLERADLPSGDEWIQLRLQGQLHRCALACMAAARERYLDSAERFMALPEPTLELLVLQKLSGEYVSETPWHEALLQARPDIVSRAYLRYLLAMLPTGQPMNGSRALLLGDKYASVARLTVPVLFPSLLNSLPQAGWDAVRDLWQAGVKHADTSSQRQWLERQWESAQGGRRRQADLLAMALSLDPAAYESRVSGFTRSPARCRLLALALLGLEVGRNFEHWPESLLLTQTENLAALYPPTDFIGGSTHRSPLNGPGHIIGTMLQTLASRTSDSMASELARLAAKPELARWRRQLTVALSDHQANRRHALFQIPTPGRVAATLQGGAPNGIADLQALVMHELINMAKDIRDGSGERYKQFWSEDSYGRVTEPKIENSGRDVLLAMLRERFARLDLSIVEEHPYADAKRADISFECAKLGSRLRLPVEIKRSMHDELWTAVSEQLVPRYTRDPGSMGYGVYLVLWFGQDKVKQPPKPLAKPSTADELQRMLEEGLSEVKRPLIRICVIDVAKPA
ncbi:hypothetical protein KIF53_01925 [Chromobacterium subtsugae]|uniref:ATP-binding protein n=1 Tax=Chromobacterium subtsugae TaxID=251747 RepID=A0ABS7F9E5_9NEIS|nr:MULTISPECIES: hypothetical protein [Chromobacterium]KUM03932.1 hypothetical protein Cv017_17145 [Chromobacterium subtsugae]MBW7565076.1 hypothetical protein [Chromobacterium subtsugae]MBW8286396.1 hypothetical protein [Chromobacterium subtsugae]WSE91560.1 hypothetical protein U6115_22270 [Chromobacterium subtsugae]WVH59935.1 hypothetical protein U6151_22300 [Chromobacterium subtsugae]